jgi:hypothetical protein
MVLSYLISFVRSYEFFLHPGVGSVVDPHHFGNLDPHPDPHPHQMKIRSRIKNFKLDPEPDPDPHQFADVKPNCMEFELF